MNDMSTKPEVHPLTNLVQYQEGSIVSRTLLKKAKGNVTLFAFAAGENLSEHTSPHDALVLISEGDMEISVMGEAHQATTGDVILLPANEPHAVRAITSCKMLLIMIRE